MVCLPPPGEQSLLSVTAEKFFLVHRDRPKRLEGTTFDKNGDMYFTSNYTMGELEARYALGNGKNAEPVAALRLLERVKALSGEKILKGRSRR